MKNRIKCIMLIDDNVDDNFFHERVIKKSDSAIIVIAKETVMAALDYLRSKKENGDIHPDLILLDINMPGMNGWEFLQEYDKLDKHSQTSTIVIMLTTSNNPDDKIKAKLFGGVSEFKTKPLSEAMLKEIIDAHFDSRL